MLRASGLLEIAMPPFLYEAGPRGLWVFLLATVILGGTAARVTGAAIAETWRPFWQLPAYVLLLTLSVRFVHFSVFEGKLLSLRSFLVDLVVLGVIALAGHTVARRRQMRVQYGWRGAGR